MRARFGLTLIELIVVIALLGIIAAMVGLAMPWAPLRPAGDAAAKLFDARGEALRTGRPVMVWLADSGGAASAMAFPDGSVIADSSIHVDRFTGRMLRDSEIVR